MAINAKTREVTLTYWSPVAIAPVVLHVPFTVWKTGMQGVLEVETQLELQAEAAKGTS